MRSREAVHLAGLISLRTLVRIQPSQQQPRERPESD